MPDPAPEKLFGRYQEIVLLLLGFVLTTIVGGFLADRVQRRAWLQQHQIQTCETEQEVRTKGFAQLSDRMDIDRDIRTIEWQLETLSGYFGINRDETSKPYRYCWDERAKGISLPNLSAQECLLLSLAEQQLEHLLPPRLMKSMSAFFNQARYQLGEQPEARQEREWLKKIRVVSTSQPLLPPKVDEQVFEQVCNALYGDQWLTVEYHNAAGEEKKSRVMPLGTRTAGAANVRRLPL